MTAADWRREEPTPGEGYEATLRWAARTQKNILVVGGTSSAKTSMLNSLFDLFLEECGRTTRFFLIEDTFELQCPAANMVSLQTSESVSLFQLVQVAMRMRPDHGAGGGERTRGLPFRRRVPRSSATARKEDIGARQFDPLLFHALVGVGRAEAESGEPDAVHRAFEEALDLWNRAPEVKDPRLARSLSYLGDWLVEQQRCAAAVPLLRRAIELSTAGAHSTTLRDESERLLSACD